MNPGSRADLGLSAGAVVFTAGVYFVAGLGTMLLFVGLVIAAASLTYYTQTHDRCPHCGSRSWNTSHLSREEQREIADAISDARMEHIRRDVR